MRTVYFDYNATTPLDPQVREAMLPPLGDIWGNPSSVHHVGRQARTLLDEVRERTAAVLKCKPSEVVFTSGGTESANLAVFGPARLLKARGRHLITSKIEHHAVLHSFEYLAKNENFEVTWLPVDSEGRVSPERLKSAIREDTVLVSIMAANNEIGTIQPVAELGAICRERGVIFHTDAVQWFGKEPFASIDQFNADLVSICAHKIHGPKGTGALYIRSPLHPEPILFGGSHENERRAGTENLSGIIGLTECLERFTREPVFPRDNLATLSKKLVNGIQNIEGLHLVSPCEDHLVNTVSFVVERGDSISLLAALDLEGICASSGSACSAGSVQPSHVLLAMGKPLSLAKGMVRLSMGRGSTLEEAEYVAAALSDIVPRVQTS